MLTGVPLPVAILAKCDKNLEFGEDSRLEIANLAKPCARVRGAREKRTGKMRERGSLRIDTRNGVLQVIRTLLQ